jgi:hypothetical protein
MVSTHENPDTQITFSKQNVSESDGSLIVALFWVVSGESLLLFQGSISFL